MNIGKPDAASLNKELDWFDRVMDTRIALYFNNECEYQSIYEVEPPAPYQNGSGYEAVARENDLNFDGRLILLPVLIPHIKPQSLDTFFIKKKISTGRFRISTVGSAKSMAGSSPRARPQPLS